MKTLFLAVVLTVSTLTFGCRSLDPNGSYAGQQALYNADLTISTSYDLMHTFVKWEFDNRAALTAWPEIKEAADHVRRNARQWIGSAIALRDIYEASPTDDNLKRLQTSLSLIRASLLEATKYMNQHN